MTFIPRFLSPSKGHFFLLGPRGTGKTLWTKHQFPDALHIDLLDPSIHRQYAVHPERLIDVARASPKGQPILIDEIQKLPPLLDVVHLLIEEKAGHQFILTGSSARKLRQGGVNLLGGRAAHHHLHPYMAAELGSRFTLELALEQGLLPVIWADPNPATALQSYSSLYLREEVQMEGLVRNFGAFARFLEVMSFSHAAVINFSNVARECQISRTTVLGYADILEDLLLGFRLPVFSKRAKRDLATHPKFYFFDTGVFRANRPTGPLDRPEEIDGAALEGLVAQHLRAWCDYADGNHKLHYWQTRSQVEVDFVVYGANEFQAIEVKNSNRILPEDLRALMAFGEDYPQSRRMLLYRGKERLMRNGILCMPCGEFLSALHPRNAWPS